MRDWLSHRWLREASRTFPTNEGGAGRAGQQVTSRMASISKDCCLFTASSWISRGIGARTQLGLAALELHAFHLLHHRQRPGAVPNEQTATVPGSPSHRDQDQG